MTTFRTNAMRSTILCRQEAHIAIALLCCLAAGLSTAAEPIRSSTKTHPSQWPPNSELVGRLILWRDVTIKNFLPAQGVGAGQLNWTDDTASQFDTKRQLFKPVDPESYSGTLKKMVNQQLGMQIADNTQFQFDFQRYWTVNDRQEVSVKLGLHFDFR